MIRLGLALIVLGVCLATLGAELYVGAWLAAHGIAVAVRHPWITAGLAVASFEANRRVVSAARFRRANWRAGYFRTVSP